MFAGGDGQVSCVVGDGSSLMSAVYQLAASERLFFMNLDKIEQLFIQPLLQLGRTFSHRNDNCLLVENVRLRRSSIFSFCIILSTLFLAVHMQYCNGNQQKPK